MSEAHCNNLAQRKALGLVTHDNTGGPFVVECHGCGSVYPSFQCSGGGQIADTGDYDDARCPHCQHVDPEECVNVGLAWNTQQLKINALQILLNERDEQVHSLEQRRQTEQQACMAAERNAARYLWLRDKPTFIWLIQDWLPNGAEFTDVDAVIDAFLSSQSAPADNGLGEPVLQWSDDDGLTWMDGKENEMASARCAGWKTRTLYRHPAEQPAPVACAHEWTDDGEFILVCTACGAQEDYTKALQRAFELGGTDDGSYHLEADELCEVIRLHAKQSAPVAVVMPERLQQVLKFLDGAENLDGHWFGEPHPSGRSYWWRTELRKALEETNLFAKQQ